MTEAEVLVRVQAPHFTAGLTLAGGICVTAAPILAWCKGKSADYLRAYFKKKDWKAHIVHTPIDCKVTLTRATLLKTPPKERAQLEGLFGAPMIASIAGGNCAEFEGEWELSYPKTG